MLRRLLSRLSRGTPKRSPTADAFLAAVSRLGPRDIAIDCGANVGRFTLPMAKSGATVHAFEPNPDAFVQLGRNLAGFSDVHLHHKAVSDRAGAVKLYLHEFAELDPLKWSTGSSLLEFKGNVHRDTFVNVEAIDFVEFLLSLGRPVALVKMDIEGAEVSVLERLLESGLYGRIGQAFVEVHDRKVRELAERTERLRRLLRERGISNIDLGWH